MLSVMAAIQSGAHTRRKPRYIKEQALVSFLYPITTRESLSVKSSFELGAASVKSTLISNQMSSELAASCSASFSRVALSQAYFGIDVKADKNPVSGTNFIGSALLSSVKVEKGISDNVSMSPVGHIASSAIKKTLISIETKDGLTVRNASQISNVYLGS